MNLAEGLQLELKRNRELLIEYEKIPQGVFGAIMIKNLIERTEKAMLEGDCIEMINCYKELQETN